MSVLSKITFTSSSELLLVIRSKPEDFGPHVLCGFANAKMPPRVTA
jgi:hypothetical protein